MNAYQQLEKIYQELSALHSALSLMHWDSATLMTEGSGKYRGDNLAALTSLNHKLSTSNQIKELITEAKKCSLSAWETANLNEIEYNFVNDTLYDEKLVADLAKAGHETELLWRSAKAKSDFNLVADKLENLISLVRKQAKIKADYYKTAKYDALIDMYDRGSKAEKINVVFDDLLNFLPDFIHKVTDAQQTKGLKPKDIELDIELQQKVCRKIATDLGFDFNMGRMDESIHPFCGGTSTDVRFTTNYNKDNALSAIMGVVHETGHAIYEQGLPKEYAMQPVGKAMGMTWHESQSLTYEMQLGSSQYFIEYLVKVFKDIAKLDISYEQLWINLNYVQPSFIRIFADEVTYPLHIILRFKLEQMIIDENLAVKEIPVIWNQLMKKYLGITPANDAQGCLQDIHWYAGWMGYFPSYSLGAITAAQIFDKFKSNNTLSFENLKSWLNQNIHNFGKLNSSLELITKVTGEELNTKYYKQYLTGKYLK